VGRAAVGRDGRPGCVWRGQGILSGPDPHGWSYAADGSHLLPGQSNSQAYPNIAVRKAVEDSLKDAKFVFYDMTTPYHRGFHDAVTSVLGVAHDAG
jgi:hypothetical protein